MKNYLLALIIWFSACVVSLCQAPDHSTISDGPYIFRRDRASEVLIIEAGLARHEELTPETFTLIKEKYNLLFSFRDVKRTYIQKPEYKFAFSGVDSIGVISDVHGNFVKYLKILKAQGIIDNKNNWSFGKGHLVILGDCFDRGENVTELLWHIFGLEKQAKKAGGMVHVIQGNHEVMMISNDSRYINSKYRAVSEITGKSYNELFSPESLLGRWIRLKPVIITINDILFVHGGISPEIIRKDLYINEINHLFRQMQTAGEVESENDIKNIDLLTRDLGPVWYRGYFNDPEFTEIKADSILGFFKKEHIVVGHTTSDGFMPKFGNKIIGIDAGIGHVYNGAMLIIKDNSFYKGTGDALRIKF